MAAATFAVTADGTFRLPRAIATQTTAILGIRGSGKTTTATVMVEELLDLGHQVVVMDPTDVWWGLRSSASGDAPGHPVVVLGGDHADLDLAADDGSILADFVVDNPVPAIFSLRHLRKAAQRRFVATFLEQLYHRKGKAEHRRPLLVVIDEASTFVPQRVQGDVARCVGAVEDLVRRGRASGFGVILVDQRPASVNKDVLTQLEVMVAHKVTAPQDRKALDEWVKAHDSEGHRARFMADLASLGVGQAYFWSPGLDIFARQQVRMRNTFDSSKTPELDDMPHRPQTLAAVDLDALRDQLGSVIEQRRQDDPAHLKERIAELEASEAAWDEVEATRNQQVGSLVDALAAMAQHLLAISEEAMGIGRTLARLHGRPVPYRDHDKDDAVNRSEPTQVVDVAAAAPKDEPGGRMVYPVESAPGRPGVISGADGIQVDRSKLEAVSNSTAPQRILDALAALDALDVVAPGRGTVAVMSRQSPRSSAYKGHLSRLRAAGLVTYPSADTVAATPAGLAQADPADPITSLDQLHQAWMRVLRSDSQRAVLRVLIQAWPHAMTRDRAAERAGQSPFSSQFKAHLAELRSLGVADYPSSTDVVATDLLFPEVLR